MNTWIALFRGINVGGHRKLPMKELVAELSKLGLSNVHTYIQSGNAIFRSPESVASALSGQITDAIQASHGFRPDVMILRLDTFRAAIAANPFPISEAEFKTVHLYFLAEPAANPDLAILDAAKTGSEEYRLDKQVFYLRTPDGYGASKLAQIVERALGIPTTARNWRSVTRILEIAEGIQ